MAGCSQPRVEPSPRPSQRPAPRPAPLAPAGGDDWREAPLTPGTWSWTRENGHSVARFGAGRLVLRCDRGAAQVRLELPGEADGPVPLVILTDTARKDLTAGPLAGTTGMIAASLPVRDPVLDAMVFSRGRFAIIASGAARLIVPSWPEVGRVVEDCR